jgi:hypothetical protein
MPTSRGTVRTHTTAVWDSERQAGAVSRRQLLSWGWTSEEIQGQVRAKRWRRVHRGVYLTATGPPAREAILWAALLAAGEGAVLAGRTAAEVWGFGPQAPGVVVAVPSSRKVRQRLIGVHVVRSDAVVGRADLGREPPRTTVEDTVLDLVSDSDDDREAVGWITAALASRKTYPGRLLLASLQRRRLARRSLVEATCGKVQAGSTTPLEIGWVDRVERPHGLPEASRQEVGASRAGRVFRDVAYHAYGLIVELDGRLGHEGAENAFRDMDRDNRAVLGGRVTLRFGWVAVMGHPCEAALQVAHVLAARGWTGELSRCGPGCLATG